ncbi:MAG TPA: hypothetical protein VGO72_06935 [Herminiimonas sp.]|nr:hypothetical protein [Herminiimonas sp.]
MNPSRLPSFFSASCAIAAALAIMACSPKFDWRDVRNDSASYMVAMPDKPVTFSRDIDLQGVKVSMTMTAAEIDNVTFAVGTAELPDATQAQVSLNAMKIALVRNIGGTIRQEKVLTMSQSARTGSGTVAVTEIEAIGPASTATAGQPRVLYARFIARDRRVYQLVATGPNKSLSRDIVDIFFSSFRLD